MYGQLPAGVRLGEVEWANRLEVHRAALREAMALLAHEGLLVRGARGGFFTPRIDEQDVLEIWETRTIMEVGAIRLIARQELAAEAFEPMVSLCDTMQTLMTSAIWLGFAEADRRYHETLVGLSGNARLTRMYRRAALPHLTFSAHSDPALVAERATQTLEEHRQIVACLAERRYAEATRKLEDHLNTAERLLRVDG